MSEVTSKTRLTDGKSGSPRDGRRRDRLLVALASRQHRAVATWQLLELGITADSIRRRVERRQLHRIHHGVYAVGTPELTRHGRWMAAVLACGRQALLSHRDAAALWGLIDYTQDVIDVTVPGSNRGRLAGIRRHGARSLAEADRTSREGIPVASIARTLLDLASVLPTRLVQRAYEQAASDDLLDVRAIQELLGRSRGRKGVRVLRRILDVDTSFAARARSELELMFADLIRASDLPMHEPTAMVRGYEVDAYWADANLVVELDSRSFHTSAFGPSAMTRRPPSSAWPGSTSCA